MLLRLGLIASVLAGCAGPTGGLADGEDLESSLFDFGDGVAVHGLSELVAQTVLDQLRVLHTLPLFQESLVSWGRQVVLSWRNVQAVARANEVPEAAMIAAGFTAGFRSDGPPAHWAWLKWRDAPGPVSDLVEPAWLEPLVDRFEQRQPVWLDQFWDGVAALLAADPALREMTFAFPSGLQTRNLVHVQEAVQAAARMELAQVLADRFPYAVAVRRTVVFHEDLFPTLAGRFGQWFSQAMDDPTQRDVFRRTLLGGLSRDAGDAGHLNAEAAAGAITFIERALRR